MRCATVPESAHIRASVWAKIGLKSQLITSITKPSPNLNAQLQEILTSLLLIISVTGKEPAIMGYVQEPKDDFVTLL